MSITITCELVGESIEAEEKESQSCMRSVQSSLRSLHSQASQLFSQILVCFLQFGIQW